MGTIIMDDGSSIVLTNMEEREMIKIFKARKEFAEQYCIKKGWPTDPEELTIDQIMEIRSQDGWKMGRETGGY